MKKCIIRYMQALLIIISVLWGLAACDYNTVQTNNKDIYSSSQQNKTSRNVSQQETSKNIVSDASQVQNREDALQTQANVNTENNTVSVPKVSQSNLQQTDKKETIVYITKTGKKYHRDGCRYLSKSRIPVNLSDAISQGYGACSVCRP